MSKESDFSVALNAEEALKLHGELGQLSHDLGSRYIPLPEGLANLYMALSSRIFDMHRAVMSQQMSGVTSAMLGDNA